MIQSCRRQVNVPEFIPITEALDADATELFLADASRVECSLTDSLNFELNRAGIDLPG
jgi:hypothetical protein